MHSRILFIVTLDIWLDLEDISFFSKNIADHKYRDESKTFKQSVTQFLARL